MHIVTSLSEILMAEASCIKNFETRSNFTVEMGTYTHAHIPMSNFKKLATCWPTHAWFKHLCTYVRMYVQGISYDKMHLREIFT